MTQNKKRHHYIPRFYLDGFTESLDSPILYRYERGRQEPLLLTTESVGFEKHFYTITNSSGQKDSNTIEDFLANNVESPAQSILRKIRNQEMIAPAEKLILSRYIVYLMRRVPHSRERVDHLAAKVIRSTSESLNADIDKAISKYPKKAQQYEERRSAIAQALEKYGNTIPKDVIINSLRYTAPHVTATISEMTWQFLVCGENKFFITSDNPVFFDEGLGIQDEKAEISIPISKSIALWITWSIYLRDDFILTTDDAVAEINRRTLHAMTRYIFAPKNVNWLTKLVNRGSHSLHRLK